MVSEVSRVAQPEVTTKLENMSLKSPAKPVFDDLDDLDVVPGAMATAESGDNALEDFRLCFVGDVDLEEKDEPLLKESRRRFVLFPIQYHEVGFLLRRLYP